MKQKRLALVLILVLSLFTLTVHSQDYASDTLAVRAILDSNGLDSIPVASVSDSSGGRINMLILSNRQLTTLPSEVGQLLNVEWIFLDQNQLTALPAEFGLLQNLTMVFLDKNRFATFPPAITQLPNLTGLSLESNLITSIPPEIGQLQNLNALTIEKNMLTALPVEIGQLQNLEYCYLGGNQITVLPPEIGTMTKLQGLDLIGNLLTALPAEIGQLTNLLELNIRDNKLASLPDEIVTVAPTDTCDFGYNQLDPANLSGPVVSWLYTHDPDWKETQSVTDIHNSTSVTTSPQFSLKVSQASINFTLPAPGAVILDVLDLKGRKLATLIDSYKPSGSHFVGWNDNRYASGIYYLRLSTGNKAIIQNTVIVK